MITCKFEDNGEAKLRHVVMNAIAEKDGNILFVKRAGNILDSGKWGLPGGYLNRDENIFEGVLREMQEETGWKGEVISLFRINSSPVCPGTDRQNVKFEFLIRPLEKIGEPDHEVSEIRWVPITELPPLSSLAFDHGETIGLYLSFIKKPFALPIMLQ